MPGLKRCLFDEMKTVELLVYFGVGRFDFMNCFAVTELNYQELQAPTKELIWLENSAHFPHYSEADRCQQILIDLFTPPRR